MEVVPACVHLSVMAGGERKARLFPDRQRVDVRPKRDNGTAVQASRFGDQPGLKRKIRNPDAGFREPRADRLRRPELLVRQFRMRMQLPADRDELGVPIRQRVFNVRIPAHTRSPAPAGNSEKASFSSSNERLRFSKSFTAAVTINSSTPSRSASSSSRARTVFFDPFVTLAS